MLRTSTCHPGARPRRPGRRAGGLRPQPGGQRLRRLPPARAPRVHARPAARSGVTSTTASWSRCAGPAPTWCRSRPRPPALDGFAARARRAGRRCSSILGPADAVLGLWDRLERPWWPARDVRADQPLLALDRDPARGARPARPAGPARGDRPGRARRRPRCSRRRSASRRSAATVARRTGCRSTSWCWPGGPSSGWTPLVRAARDGLQGRPGLGDPAGRADPGRLGGARGCAGVAWRLRRWPRSAR